MINYILLPIFIYIHLLLPPRFNVRRIFMKTKTLIIELLMNKKHILSLKKIVLVLIILGNNFPTFSQSNFVYFNYPQNAYCTYSNDPTPTITAVGGTFSSTSGLVINSSTGVIDLDASSPGI